MTLLQIKTAAAAYLEQELADLTVNGVDLCLVALNQARQAAEQLYDWEFSRKLVTVAVNGVTGGSLDDAVFTPAAAAIIGTILDVGMFDSDGNLIPVEWTTVAEGMDRQRYENRGQGVFPRYPTDAQYKTWLEGQARVTFSGSSVYRWPKDATANYTLGIECYTDQVDWLDYEEIPSALVVTGSQNAAVDGTYDYAGTLNEKPYFRKIREVLDLIIWFDGAAWNITDTTTNSYYQLATNSSTGVYTGFVDFVGTSAVVVERAGSVSPWLTRGSQYLLWQTIIQLNYLNVRFVNRQEGNLPPPEKLAAAGLEQFRLWDVSRFEQNRRSSR